MTAVREHAIHLLNTLPEEKVHFLIGIMERMQRPEETPDSLSSSQVAYQRLQQFRRPNSFDVDDYKSALHEAWEQKYANLD